MARPRSEVPAHRHHRQPGQAVVTIRRPDGTRRNVLLGRYGTPESKAEYERQLALMRSWAAALPSPADPDVTVNELLLTFVRHADDYFRHPDGTPTSEAQNVRDALRHLKR